MSSATRAGEVTRDVVNPHSPEEFEWQRLWFSLRAHTWRSLAVVGIGSASNATGAANKLIQVAARDEKTPVGMISTLGMSFQDTTSVVTRLRDDGAGLTLVVCDSPAVNPAAIPVVHAVSGVVIVVKLGEARLDAVARAVELAGRDRVLATVTVG